METWCNINAAFSSSFFKEMNDPCAVSRCLYLLAVLANLEKNHRQSKVLIEKAQRIGGSEHFWHRSTLCLTDAILGQDKEEEDKMVRSVI